VSEWTEPDTVLVHCDRLARIYGSGANEVVAVYDIECTVAAGDRIAITGPSGSGKSTLLHLMGGLDTPTAGVVTWPGLPGRPADHPGVVGFVFQAPSLIATLDVVENVALPLLIAGTAEADAHRRARAALDELAVGELADRLPTELSGGQAQRVAVARVLAARPRLILADEPTAQLDPVYRDLVTDTLLAVSRRLGAGLVVSTHDPIVAGHFPQRWHMRDGGLSGGVPAASTAGGAAAC
jgi:putative ABC transport system ATP-binding protein